jgi:hypothetical protein
VGVAQVMEYLPGMGEALGTIKKDYENSNKYLWSTSHPMSCCKHLLLLRRFLSSRICHINPTPPQSPIIPPVMNINYFQLISLVLIYNVLMFSKSERGKG